MSLRSSAALLFVFFTGCRAASEEPEPASAVAPVPQARGGARPTAASVADQADARSEAIARALEQQGAPYERRYSEKLAVVVPRELTGAEADERPRRAFEALSHEEQLDFLEWFTVECEKLGTFQWTLIRYVIDGSEKEEASWPELAAPTWYDEQQHAPDLPIARRPLDPDAPEVRAVRNQILAAVGTRKLDSGWMVDYAQRSLVRLPHQGDPRRVFENALLGMAPDWDLAEALVDLALDDGALQKNFAAFAHAYTDRWGGVYPGVTLYDAHSSRIQIEMPDVDSLGIVHDLDGDWDTWKSPVPAEQHAELYARVGGHFKAALRHRGLRQNLARTYLCGSAELRDSYANNLDNFHALWESVGSEPAALAAKLPDSEGWAAFLQGWHDSLVADPQPFLKGTTRHAQLERDAQRVRARLVSLLEEYGAYQRIETLPPFDAP